MPRPQRPDHHRRGAPKWGSRGFVRENVWTRVGLPPTSAPLWARPCARTTPLLGPFRGPRDPARPRCGSGKPGGLGFVSRRPCPPGTAGASKWGTRALWYIRPGRTGRPASRPRSGALARWETRGAAARSAGLGSVLWRAVRVGARGRPRPGSPHGVQVVKEQGRARRRPCYCPVAGRIIQCRGRRSAKGRASIPHLSPWRRRTIGRCPTDPTARIAPIEGPPPPVSGGVSLEQVGFLGGQ